MITKAKKCLLLATVIYPCSRCGRSGSIVTPFVLRGEKPFKNSKRILNEITVKVFQTLLTNANFYYMLAIYNI